MKIHLKILIVVWAIVFGLTGCDSSTSDSGGETTPDSGGDPTEPVDTDTAQIRGKARYSTEDDSSGIQITLLTVKNQATLLQDQTNTDKTGEYLFDNVPLGEYTLVAASNDSTEKALLRNVAINASEVFTVDDLTLTPTGTINGKATLEGRDSHEGILVFLLGTSWNAYTDTQGNFVFADVPVGDYEIKYSYTGYASTTPTAIQVAKGQETSTDPVALLFLSSVGSDPMAGGILKGVALVEESVASNGSGPFRTIVFKRLIQKNVLIPDLYAVQTVSSACKGCAVKVWPKNGESEDSGISGQTDDNGEFTVSNL
ncbi:MAG: carboxypeptidase regulatory-like domain-containing protein, partial [Proteobacteria bacterium]|nr:carboxypeptidase regulatory-like domain-containing protein [Pseudomonadota bacterium]